MVSRDELLKFVELDLWGRFQVRLWTLLGILLTLISIAGYLGVPYYIETEIERRFADQKQSFERRAAEVLTYAQLLQILSLQRSVQSAEFEKRVAALVHALDEHASKTEKSDPTAYSQADDLRSELITLQYRQSYESSLDAGNELRFFLSSDFGKTRILPAEMIVQEIRGPAGSSMARYTHPVQNGTVSGALRDLRFRMVELQAYGNAIAFVEARFAELGGMTPLAKRQQAVAVQALMKEMLEPKYAAERQLLSAKFLSDEERELFNGLQALYQFARTER